MLKIAGANTVNRSKCEFACQILWELQFKGQVHRFKGFKSVLKQQVEQEH